MFMSMAWAASPGLIEPMAAGRGEKLPVSYRIVKLPEYCHERLQSTDSHPD